MKSRAFAQRVMAPRAQVQRRAPLSTPSPAPSGPAVGAAATTAAVGGDWLGGLGPLVVLDAALADLGVPEPLRLLGGSMERLAAARDYALSLMAEEGATAGAESADAAQTAGPTVSLRVSARHVLALLRHAYGDAPPGFEQRVTSLLTGGAPLAPEHAARFGAALGHDLSHVRVHTDSRAATAADEINARAFAVGADLFFAPGQFSPGTPGGDRLLAHELTHVVQHDEGRLPSGGGVSRPTDPTEREAYANESRVLGVLSRQGDAVAPTEDMPFWHIEGESAFTADAGAAQGPSEEAGQAVGPTTGGLDAPVQRINWDAVWEIVEGQGGVVVAPMGQTWVVLLSRAYVLQIAPDATELTGAEHPDVVELVLRMLFEQAGTEVDEDALANGLAAVTFPLRTPPRTFEGRGYAIAIPAEAEEGALQVPGPQGDRSAGDGGSADEGGRSGGQADQGQPATSAPEGHRDDARDRGDGERPETSTPSTDASQVGEEPQAGIDGGDVDGVAMTPPSEEEDDGGLMQVLWEVLAGDFIEDPSAAAIIIRTLLGLIPYVDQALDIEDTVAVLYKLIWEGRVDDVWVWFDLVLCVIGWIPELGSLAEGVLRLIKKAGRALPLDEIAGLIRHLGLDRTVDDVVRWIGDLFTSGLVELAAKVKGKAAELLNDLLGKLEIAAGIASAVSSEARRRIDDAIEATRRALGELPTKIDEAIEALRSKVDEFMGARRADAPSGPGSHTPHGDGPDVNTRRSDGPDSDGSSPSSRQRELTPEERETRLRELETDPENAGRVTPGTRAEAEAALGLEQRGDLPPPVRRPSPVNGEHGDFVDGTGRLWDVKAPQSRQTLQRRIEAEAAAEGRPAPRLNPNRKIRGEFNVNSQLDTIRDEIASGESVILDLRGLTPEDATQLREAVEAAGLLDHVRYFE